MRQRREPLSRSRPTCLKQCYFETYRFSEDLDFSLLRDAVYTRVLRMHIGGV